MANKLVLCLLCIVNRLLCIVYCQVKFFVVRESLTLTLNIIKIPTLLWSKIYNQSKIYLENKFNSSMGLGVNARKQKIVSGSQ
jgi:hypothetical protein